MKSNVNKHKYYFLEKLCNHINTAITVLCIFNMFVLRMLNIANIITPEYFNHAIKLAYTVGSISIIIFGVLGIIFCCIDCSINNKLK